MPKGSAPDGGLTLTMNYVTTLCRHTTLKGSAPDGGLTLTMNYVTTLCRHTPLKGSAPDGGLTPMPGDMVVAAPCNMDPKHAPQNWHFSAPGVWPEGSFRSEQPNIINPDSGYDDRFPPWILLG
jgi:hypothetical protein